MPDPTRIYLQPECCADPDTGRMWAAVAPEHECEHGVAWSVFVAIPFVGAVHADVPGPNAALDELLPTLGSLWGAVPDHPGKPVGWQVEYASVGWCYIHEEREQAVLESKVFTPATGRIRPVYAGEPIDVSEEPTP